ncbi:ABC transporter ATP-binding protein [Aeromicrobium sp. YIM 150415]|uniref:dipeptide ABC transporter ATP-binding protein n=1 Tax=Aeromicrobium sp. YIM 150415 TaxID=2803912 RepID=UPI001965890F|nr:ABC transporter ATP-binding protein [Aeromicrobium sp. YIM 150415]MBM9464191.1 ABC transporter ATP-binding protein [Aeromicrobium sp. YIM 150415]
MTTPPEHHPDSPTVLHIDDLSVRFRAAGIDVTAVRGLNLSLRRGEVLALVGESGSGKSMTAWSTLGLLPPAAEREGRVLLGADDVATMTEQQLRALRGDRVAMIFQDPSRALNPVFTVGAQLIDTLRAHTDISAKDARRRAGELLALVGLPDPEARVDYYPHQLSGGQKQRVAIALALCCDPEVLVADEPTTALDVTVQAEILELLRELKDRFTMSILLITHNMGVVADIADRVAVMYRGELVETGTVDQIFSAPRADYTRHLLRDVPHVTEEAISERPATAVGAGDPVVAVDRLTVMFGGGALSPGGVTAVDEVSFQVLPGETLALVGESGSGKSTTGRAIAGLQPADSGRVEILGHPVIGASGRDLRAIRREVGMVFQDPAGSLNPYHSVIESVAAPLRHTPGLSRADMHTRAQEMLDAVEIPRSFAERMPYELSGGQCQRVSLARALVRRPRLLIADEPTSALDVSVQATVLEVYRDLQHELGFASLFITHDLAVVAMLADRVAVMRHGALVEVGETRQILFSPQEDYTRELISAVPFADPEQQRERRELWRRQRAAARA